MDAPTGQVLTTLGAKHQIGQPGCTAFAAFSPDGALLAAMTQETVPNARFFDAVCRGIQVWETASGKPVREIPAVQFGRIAFSPDGRTTAVAGEDGLGAWDVVTGDEVYRRPVGDGLLRWRPPLAFSPDGRRLAVGCADSTAAVWDVSAAVHRRRRTARFSEADQDALWKDLASDDADRAYATISLLADDPAEAAALLADRLHPAAGVSRDRLDRLLRALDDDDFDKRETASKELAELAGPAETELREAVASGKLSAEQSSRVAKALASLPAAGPAETLRGLRAVRALAWAGTADARAVLEKLAGSAIGDRVRREARSALSRWRDEQ